MNTFEQMLTGGHPNSLGNTIEVVNIILEDKERLQDLYDCYFSKDEVVRLRVSNAFKRVCRVHPDWLVPYVDRFLTEIATINQASTQWTLAQLFLLLQDRLTKEQKDKATEHMQYNLQHHTDWIVLNMCIETLSKWAKGNAQLTRWLQPELVRLTNDPRGSVSRRAQKYLDYIS